MLWDSDSSERKEATHLPHSHPLILHSKKKKKINVTAAAAAGSSCSRDAAAVPAFRPHLLPPRNVHQGEAWFAG